MNYPLNAVTQARVLVLGDVMMDRYWFGEVDRISPEAPVPVVRMGHVEDRLGGAANVARNITALGGQASLLGVVGRDDTAKEMRQQADAHHIRCHLHEDDSMATTLKLRVLGRRQQLLRVDFEDQPGEAALLAMRQCLLQQLPHHDVLVLSDYAKGALRHVEQLIQVAVQLAKPVLVDPKGNDYLRYSGATIITPNRAEMQQAVGHWSNEQDLALRAQNLRQQLKLDAILMTRSEQGMTLFTEDGATHVGALAQEVFDVSGAGDTVLATLALMRAAGLSWAQAMNWANKAGGIVVGKLGTSVVTAKELQ